MDITLLRTFLAVSATGSFADASQRLFVTQSAVSLRIQRLEADLGQSLFTRSKAGAALTPQGREFEFYALSLVRIWEEARQQIAIPDGFDQSLSIGAQYSLWQRLGFRLIDRIRARAPKISLRGEVGTPERLTRFMVEGIVQAAFVFTPTLRPGLSARKLIDDDLVLAASWPDSSLDDIEGRYVFVDWGPEFVHAHAQSLPHLTNPGLTLAIGSLTAEFISRRRYAAYVPARTLTRYLEAGTLHLVAGAPSFPYPTWLVWRDDNSSEEMTLIDICVNEVMAGIDSETDEVFDQLRSLNDGVFPKILGATE
jgi:DNA-binding transcriptional LysR family regulator